MWDIVKIHVISISRSASLDTYKLVRESLWGQSVALITHPYSNGGYIDFHWKFTTQKGPLQILLFSLSLSFLNRKQSEKDFYCVIVGLLIFMANVRIELWLVKIKSTQKNVYWLKYFENPFFPDSLHEQDSIV